MNYQFNLILKEGTEITEALADELFEAGCDDGTPGTFCGTPYISFTARPTALSPRSAAPWPTSRRPAALSSGSRSNTTRRCCLPVAGRRSLASDFNDVSAVATWTVFTADRFLNTMNVDNREESPRCPITSSFGQKTSSGTLVNTASRKTTSSAWSAIHPVEVLVGRRVCRQPGAMQRMGDIL